MLVSVCESLYVCWGGRPECERICGDAIYGACPGCAALVSVVEGTVSSLRACMEPVCRGYFQTARLVSAMPVRAGFASSHLPHHTIVLASLALY